MRRLNDSVMWEYNEKTDKLGNKFLKVYPAHDGSDVICFGNGDYSFACVYSDSINYTASVKHKFPTYADYYRAVFDVYIYWYGYRVMGDALKHIARKGGIALMLDVRPVNKSNGEFYHYEIDEHTDSNGGFCGDLWDISSEDFKKALELYSPIIDDGSRELSTAIRVYEVDYEAECKADKQLRSECITTPSSITYKEDLASEFEGREEYLICVFNVFEDWHTEYFGEFKENLSYELREDGDKQFKLIESVYIYSEVDDYTDNDETVLGMIKNIPYQDFTDAIEICSCSLDKDGYIRYIDEDGHIRYIDEEY